MAPSAVVPDLPKLLILPKGTSPRARVLSLRHPRTLTDKRYFFCPDKGLYEFTRLSTPGIAPRSCLIGPEQTTAEIGREAASCAADSSCPPGELAQASDPSISTSKLPGYLLESTEYLVATPIDPMFLLLPTLCPVSSAKLNGPSDVFRSADDLFDQLVDASQHFSFVLQEGPMREFIEGRIASVCDSVVAGDEMMYRLSNEKLVHELIAKAKRMVLKGLPETFEARFVRKALEVPIMSVKREESMISVASTVDPDEDASGRQSGIQTPSESIDSQTSASTSAASNSLSSSATSISATSESARLLAPEGVPELLRLRSALSYMLSAYVPPHLSKSIHDFTSSPSSPVDFGPLDLHLSHLAKLRTEALASRSLSDFSRKRGIDDEELESRAEKKRRKEEEEKRKKATESRGVRDLKKVDTTGMKKMSAFFGKATVQKKKA